jgi:thiol-disulfide isomerase/thioredoxin
MNRSRRWASTIVLLAIFAVGRVAAGADQKPEANKPAAAKPAGPKADPFKVPNGTAEELITYLDTLGEARPEKDDPATVGAFRKKLFETAITVADKILAAKPNDRQAELAVQVKAQGLFALKSLGDAEAGKRLEALPAELEKMGRPKLGRQVARVLLANRVRQLVRANPAELRGVVEELKKFVGQKPEAADLELVMGSLEIAEVVDRPFAAECYAYFGKLFSGASDPQLKSLGAKLAGTARRLGLIGQKMELEGTTLAGKPLNIDQLRGKVVLVVYWATWCGPCRAEIPEIKEAYAEYHPKGFEVVSISLDREREDLEAFVKEEKLPWPVLFDADPNKHGFEHPMAARYGVMAIPAMVLLDKEGKGAALDPRGPALGQELAKLLGPAGLKPPATGGDGVSIPLPLLGRPAAREK